MSVPPSSSLPSTTPAIDAIPDLKGVLGRPVSRVEVAIDGEPWGNTTLPRITSVRPGEPLTETVARKALDEALDTGRFARARVLAVVDGAGVRLIVKVVARKLIESLRVDLGGARNVDREELLREGGFAEGGELVGADLGGQQDKMEAFLARHGYPDATVSLTTRLTDDPLRVIVLFELHPHEPRVVDRRAFYVFDAKPADVASATDGYGVRSGDRADETTLEAADVALESKLRAMGYYDADVSHDVVRAGGGIVLRVRVDAGHLFVPRFEGNDHFDAVALTGALGIDTENDLSPSHLIDKLRDYYRKHGFYDAEVTLEERGAPNEQLHYLVFKIIEHRRVTVVARAYPCVKEEEISRLREGGPKSASAIGSEIDSYLEEELPGADLLVDPNPHGLDRVITSSQIDSRAPLGRRAVPLDLEPDATYVPDTYDRAVAHVQELYRNEGFLHAQVGPVQVVRRKCSPRSPAGQCVPIAPPPGVAGTSGGPPEACTYDATNLPLPVAPLDPALACTPDPARGVECEPNMALRVPIKLGPRTYLYDVGFNGAHALSEQALAKAADLDLGGPANALKLEDARRRVLDLYREQGYAFADVKYSLEESLDHTRARVRFDIGEGEQVIVRQIVIQGNDLTRENVIRRRIALRVDEPYRASLVRKTQERIATLNVFSSVTVGLADPYVPAKNKTVVITVAEVDPFFVEVRPGFSTGEGFRLTTEFGDRNILGSAIGVSTRLQISLLPDFVIVDPQVRENFQTLCPSSSGGICLGRVAGRITIHADFPEIGIGPLVRMGIDGVIARTLLRDFVLTKYAAIPSFNYRPMRHVTIVASPSIERNDVKVFSGQSVEDFLRSAEGAGNTNLDITRALLVPDGTSNAYAQRVVLSWDRRDNSFNAHTGTFLASGVEHVDWYPVHTVTNPSTFDGSYERRNFEGHFLRFTETLAGYIPITKRITLAMELRLGANVQIVPDSHTYPDRLFFMGGIESMRGWTQDTFIPQDLVDRIEADARNVQVTSGTRGVPNGQSQFTASSIAIRGGNLMVNPKVELRLPLRGPLETALFTDVGNLWVDPLYPFDTGKFPFRASVGTGIRYQTPIGPLALDGGLNVTRHSAYEDVGAVNFSIGLF